jgi:hypothetical protein
MQFVNNIVRTSTGPYGIDCDSTYTSTPPTFTSNDLFATRGTLLRGSCVGALAGGGNISVDPQFARERPRTAYRLTAGSPAIDAGVPTSLAAAPMPRAGRAWSTATATARR